MLTPVARGETDLQCTVLYGGRSYPAVLFSCQRHDGLFADPSASDLVINEVLPPLRDDPPFLFVFLCNWSVTRGNRRCCSWSKEQLLPGPESGGEVKVVEEERSNVPAHAFLHVRHCQAHDGQDFAIERC